jgi:hypothetical protein
MNKYDFLRIISNRRFCTFALIALMVLANLTTIGFAQTTPEDAANCLNRVFCNIARLIFMIAAGLAALIIILAGLRWITAADDPGARNGAKTTIISAIVGLIIIMIAVYIVAIVVNGMLPGGSNVNPVSWMTGDCTSGCETGGDGG